MRAVHTHQHAGPLRIVQCETQIGAAGAGDTAWRILDLGIGAVDGAFDAGTNLVGDGSQQALAVFEMIVKTALPNLRRLDDVVDGHGIHWPLGEQAERSEERRVGKWYGYRWGASRGKKHGHR